MTRQWMGRVLLGIGLGIGTLTPAPAADSLGWSKCRQLAEANNSSLKSAEQQVKQSRANLTQARSPLFPQINASASAGISQTEDYPQSKNFSYGLNASQLLFDGFKTFREWDQAQWQVQADEVAYQLIRADVDMKLRQSFIAVLHSQQDSSLTEKIAGRRSQNLALVKLSFAAGREHHGSLLLAQAQAAQAQHAMVVAARTNLLVHYNLQAVVGSEIPLDQPLAGEMHPAPAVLPLPDFSLLLKQHPTVSELELSIHKAESAYQNTLAEFYPSLKAQAGLARSGNTFPPDSTGWSAGLNLSWPLFQGGSRWADVARAEAVLEKTRQNAAGQKAQLLTQLVSAWNSYANDMEDAKIQEQFLAAALERSKISERQYSTGTLTFDNWSRIEDDLVSAQKNWLNAQADALNSEAAWVYAQGGVGNYEE